MSKIEPLPGCKWSAHAALHDTLNTVSPEDRIIILFEMVEEGSIGFRSANIKESEAIYLMEDRKFKMFFERGDE